MDHKKIFFISSESNLKEIRFFDGYAFSNVDLIVGNKGFSDFCKDGKQLNGYEDGNYVLFEQLSDTLYKLSRDYHGYYPLFYYKSEDYWCISNSIIYIAECLKSKDIAFSYDESNIEIWKSELALALQLSSHNTFIREIKVLPVNRDIIIFKSTDENKIALNKRGKNELIEDNYDDALRECLKIWGSRYLTILSNENIALHQDLTGGLDSRSIFSFIVKDMGLIADSLKTGRLKINSEPAKTKDFEIAQRLLNLFDIDVNSRINKKYMVDKVSSEEAYATWKYFNVGRYSPIIFPIYNFNPSVIELGGEGGEDNRNFYGKQPDGSFEEFHTYINKYKHYFSTEERYAQWLGQVKESLSVLKEDSELDPSILHYKEFRSNAHTSKNPKSRFKFGVLGSKYFDSISQLSSVEKTKTGQVLYDLIYSNCNRLLYIPFDEEKKGMSDENISKLTSIDNSFSLRSGKIYSDNHQSTSEYLVDIPVGSDLASNPLQILSDKAFKSLETNKDSIEYFFGKSYVDKYYKKFQEIDFDKQKGNLHTKGVFLHALILIDTISETQSGKK